MRMAQANCFCVKQARWNYSDSLDVHGPAAPAIESSYVRWPDGLQYGSAN